MLQIFIVVSITIPQLTILIMIPVPNGGWQKCSYHLTWNRKRFSLLKIDYSISAFNLGLIECLVGPVNQIIQALISLVL